MIYWQNWKLKAKIKIAKDLGRDELEKIGREAVAEALEGKNVVKVIAVYPILHYFCH